MEASAKPSMSSEEARYNKLHDAVRAKVTAIFTEMAGDRASRLRGLSARVNVTDITKALTSEHGAETARDIAFHLTDWKEDGAFLVAVLLFPEKFTRKEITCGLGSLLCHAPNHLAAAATLAEYPIQDVWEIGVPQHPEDEAS
jgi:hypothetical protein